MSDQELRELERAASTGDAASTWKLVRALERLGEKRRRLSALCALARRGDGEAVAAIHRISPRPSPSRKTRVDGLRGKVRRVEHRELSQVELFASDGHVFARDLAEGFRFEHGPFVPSSAEPLHRFDALVGDETVHVEGNEIVVRDGETILARSGRDPARVSRDVFVSGDRAVLCSTRRSGRAAHGQDTRLDVVDLRDGAHLFSVRRDEEADDVDVTLDAILATRRLPAAPLTCHDLETGALRWTRRDGWVVDADERAVLIEKNEPDLPLALLDARTGEPLWELPRGYRRGRAVLGPVVLAWWPVDGSVSTNTVAAFSRATGETLWKVTGLRVSRVEVTNDVAYVVDVDPPRITVQGRDLSTGELVLSEDLEDDAVHDLLALPGRLLVSTTRKIVEVSSG